MPHKHKVLKSKDRSSTYDLPPTLHAKPLPVENSRRNAISKRRVNEAAKTNGATLDNGYSYNDTPKAFERLMQLQMSRRAPDGLDGGLSQPRKKRKVDRSETVKKKPDVPEILPGERLSDFNARVDQALPIAGISRKGRGAAEIKQRQTKKERKMQKMQAEWRKEEARRKEKEEAIRDEVEEGEAEKWGVSVSFGLGPEDKRSKGKKKRTRGMLDDDDPWAALKQTRNAPAGLHDVAQAPPQLKRLPKSSFKVKDGARVDVANVPGVVGSLRKREELGETRTQIIDSYRRLMEDRRIAR